MLEEMTVHMQQALDDNSIRGVLLTAVGSCHGHNCIIMMRTL